MLTSEERYRCRISLTTHGMHICMIKLHKMQSRNWLYNHCRLSVYTIFWYTLNMIFYFMSLIYSAEWVQWVSVCNLQTNLIHKEASDRGSTLAHFQRQRQPDKAPCDRLTCHSPSMLLWFWTAPGLGPQLPKLAQGRVCSGRTSSPLTVLSNVLTS